MILHETTIALSNMFFEEGFQRGKLTDLRTVEGTSCYCSDTAQEAITDAISNYGPEGLHWIDSGDYHYLTLFFIRKINEPFTLILLDNHPDDQEGAFDDGMLSCGNWVKKARESLPLMNETPGEKPVYLSIDLDILSPDEFVTDWDQGEMRMEELKRKILDFKQRHRIIGIDICGGKTKEKGASDSDLLHNYHSRNELSDFISAI